MTSKKPPNNYATKAIYYINDAGGWNAEIHGEWDEGHDLVIQIKDQDSSETAKRKARILAKKNGITVRRWRKVRGEDQNDS